MIFQHTWEKVMDGRKTQTRRLAKPGEQLINGAVVTARGVRKYYVGQVIGVQMARSQPTIQYTSLRTLNGVIHKVADPEDEHSLIGALSRLLQVRVMSVDAEDVRHIELIDAQAEGFVDEMGFWRTWCAMHDKVADRLLSGLYHEAFAMLMVRPLKWYDAWRIVFERV